MDNKEFLNDVCVYGSVFSGVILVLGGLVEINGAELTFWFWWFFGIVFLICSLGSYFLNR